MLNSLMATVSDMEVTESTGIQKILDAVNKGIIGSVAEFIGNISILFPILVFLGVLIVFLFTFRHRANKLSRTLINLLSKNGKYIKGLFVELNDAKELTRYFSHT